MAHAPLVADATVQLEMARSLATTGELRVEGDPSRFYPPLYPILLAPFGALMGFNADTIHLVQGVLLGILVFSTYVVGSAFGRRVGLAAALLTAFNPVLLAEAGEGRATLLAALLLLWVFHFVRLGVQDEAHLGWAGLLAGALYLTKDTAGYVALLGVVAGLAWRIRSMGLREVLRSRHYALGGTFFVLPAAAWAVRNLLRFGSPLTNPGVWAYTQRFVLGTPPAVALGLAAGVAGLLLLHWLLWAGPALADPRAWLPLRGRLGALRTDESRTGLLVFLSTTLLLSSLMAAVFIRGEGNRAFPLSVPLYHRLLAMADPLLMIGIALVIRAPRPLLGRDDVEGAVRAAKVTAVAALLLLTWPAVTANASGQAAVYDDLAAFLGDVEGPYYSEAATVLRANVPGLEWRHVRLDFSGPLLNHREAGVPEGGHVVTVGQTPDADFMAGPYSVILNVSWTNPPVVENPFYTH